MVDFLGQCHMDVDNNAYIGRILLRLKMGCWSGMQKWFGLMAKVLAEYDGTSETMERAWRDNL